MRPIFIPRRPREREDLNIMHTLGKSAKSGQIGIEVECEGNKFRKEGLPGLWTYHQDGSLRGQDNAEYVLSRPIMFDEVQDQIDKLWKMFDDYGTILDDTNRTSVHVHLNMLSFHLNRLCSFFGLYFIVEELLTQWCGEHRVGNLFCLRARDATGIITCLKKFLQQDGGWEISQGFHYAGLNANALHKFGSIEIRTLRGVMDKGTILDWVGILRRIYELSAEYPDPRAVVEGFSGEGPMGFLEKILGPHMGTVVNEIGWTTQAVSASVHHGVRLAQDLCYCRDWSEYKPTELVVDPFGRPKPKKKLSDSIGEYLAFAQSNGVHPTQSVYVNQAAPVWTVDWQNAPVSAPQSPDDLLADLEDNDDDEPEPEYDHDYDPADDF